MLKKLRKYWPIVILVAFTFVLRVVNIEKLFYFTYDESIPAFVARRLWLWGHVPLIGGVTPFGFHLAPYFYWFLALLLKIGNLNPIIWGYTGAAIAAFTTAAVYVVGSKFFSKTTGLTAAAFWTFSYLANVYDRHFWALYWGPLVSLLTIFSLYKIIKGNVKFIYLLAPTLAFAIHADPSNLVFLLLTVIIWIIYKLQIRKETILGVLIVLLSFLPLVVFDLRHDFANTEPVIDYWKHGKNNPGVDINKFVNNTLLFSQATSRLVYTFGDNEIAKQYSYCKEYVQEKFAAIPWYASVIASIVIATFVLANLKRKSEPGKFLVALLITLYFVAIHIYGTIFKSDIFEHYITGLFAVFVLIVSYYLAKLPKPVWITLLTIFIAANLFKLSQAQNSMGLAAKRQAIEYAMSEVADREFSLDSLSTCWKLNGYRYLFTVFGREPTKSYVDPNFAYLYGTTQIAAKHPQTVVSFVVHDFMAETDAFYKRYSLLKSHEVESASFGSIEVIVMDNSTGWFDAK